MYFVQLIIHLTSTLIFHILEFLVDRSNFSHPLISQLMCLEQASKTIFEENLHFLEAFYDDPVESHVTFVALVA